MSGWEPSMSAEKLLCDLREDQLGGHLTSEIDPDYDEPVEYLTVKVADLLLVLDVALGHERAVRHLGELLGVARRAEPAKCGHCGHRADLHTGSDGCAGRTRPRCACSALPEAS